MDEPVPASGQKRIGRFGHKAQIATLATFAAEAYLMELGITTPMFPGEICPQGDCSLLACDPVPNPEDDGSGAPRSPPSFHERMRLRHKGNGLELFYVKDAQIH